MVSIPTAIKAGYAFETKEPFHVITHEMPILTAYQTFGIIRWYIMYPFIAFPPMMTTDKTSSAYDPSRHSAPFWTPTIDMAWDTTIETNFG